MVKDSVGKRARGRPRDLKAKAAILRAAAELLDEGGAGAVTMEAVSGRAGVGKPTVYRWWPDRHAVAMAALMSADAAAPQSAPPPQRATRTALASLRDQLRQIAARLASPTGRHITSMLAAADTESELAKAFRGHFVLARRTEGRGLLEQAIVNGEIREDVNVEVALDQLYGAVFFRLLMGHAPLDASFVDDILGQTLKGMRSRAPRPKTRVTR